MKIASLSALCVLAFWVSACDKSTTTDPIVTKLSPPQPASNLFALSADAQTVRIRWKASSSESDATFQDYRLRVTNAAGQTSDLTVAKKTNPTAADTIYIANIAGLTTGSVYSFAVQGRNKDTVSSAVSVSWSPAVRLTMANGSTIKLYESASGFGSGLKIQGGVPQNLTVASGSQWDIGIDTRNDANNQPSYDIGSPELLSYTSITSFRKTLINRTYYVGVDSLNQVYDNQAIAATVATRISFTAEKKGVLFSGKTQDGNFFKVYVKANNGALLQGTSPNRYVEVEISYQPTANVGYALFSVQKPLIGTGSIQTIAEGNAVATQGLSRRKTSVEKD